MLKEQMDKIMRPKAIAVVGASTKPKTIGSEIMQRLRDYKFNGKVYPVNPKGDLKHCFWRRQAWRACYRPLRQCGSKLK